MVLLFLISLFLMGPVSNKDDDVFIMCYSRTPNSRATLNSYTRSTLKELHAITDPATATKLKGEHALCRYQDHLRRGQTACQTPLNGTLNAHSNS
jgi:hypothetical protein